MAAGVFLILLVLAMTVAGPPVALFAAVLGFYLYGRSPRSRSSCWPRRPACAALLAYAALVVLLFAGMVALGATA